MLFPWFCYNRALLFSDGPANNLLQSQTLRDSLAWLLFFNPLFSFPWFTIVSLPALLEVSSLLNTSPPISEKKKLLISPSHVFSELVIINDISVFLKLLLNNNSHWGSIYSSTFYCSLSSYFVCPLLLFFHWTIKAALPVLTVKQSKPEE